MSSIYCTSCPVTTAVNLELAAAAPSTHPVSVLPKANFLAITWTESETGAMAVVFGGGKYNFKPLSNNNYTPLVIPGMALPSGATCHAHFFQATVGGKSVVCMKSEFHPKSETAATTLFFEKILGSAPHPNFGCLITSGTAGGLGANLDVGDVVVTNQARYGLTLPPAKQALVFNGASNILGSNPPAGYATWFDYATEKIIQADACVNSGLLTSGGRKSSSPKPAIYYQPSGGDPTDIVTDERDSTLECTQIAAYRKLGATVDENDAYVAEACKAVGFQNWISIRNVSDLPCTTNQNQYTEFGYCSSINGAYAVWAFVMGH